MGASVEQSVTGRDGGRSHPGGGHESLPGSWSTFLVTFENFRVALAFAVFVHAAALAPVFFPGFSYSPSVPEFSSTETLQMMIAGANRSPVESMKDEESADRTDKNRSDQEKSVEERKEEKRKSNEPDFTREDSEKKAQEQNEKDEDTDQTETEEEPEKKQDGNPDNEQVDDQQSDSEEGSVPETDRGLAGGIKKEESKWERRRREMEQAMREEGSSGANERTDVEPSSSGVDTQVFASYFRDLQTHLGEYFDIPEIVENQQIRDRVELAVKITPEGQLRIKETVTRSMYPELNRAAREVIRRAEAFRPPPIHERHDGQVVYVGFDFE